ncbi:MAG TPA: hypothetical protein VF062_09240 [Candidatus Limnocylindrales bacterium]
MAKHFIYPTAAPAEGGLHERRVEIQWFRDQDVRVGVTKRPPVDPNRVYVSGSLAPATTTTSAASTEPSEAWDGQFVDLDRSQINHLIRQLRTARDQAYGKDE